jgi:nucleoid-associated protein YejK
MRKSIDATADLQTPLLRNHNSKAKQHELFQKTDILHQCLKHIRSKKCPLHSFRFFTAQKHFE